MSLTINMTGGGGSLGAAVVRVISSNDATVRMTRGGATKTPRAYASYEKVGYTEYYFSLASSELSSTAWTVTSAVGTTTEAKTLTVSAAGAYTVTFSAILYELGDKHTDTTGGYTIFRPDTVPASTLGANPYGATDGSTSLSIYVANIPNDMGVNAAFGTTNELDLSQYTTLHMAISKAACPSSGTSWSFMRFGVTPSLDETAKTVSTASTMTVGSDVTLDISNVSTGHVFFGFGLAAAASGGVGPVDIEVTKIWLT